MSDYLCVYCSVLCMELWLFGYSERHTLQAGIYACVESRGWGWGFGSDDTGYQILYYMHWCELHSLIYFAGEDIYTISIISSIVSKECVVFNVWYVYFEQSLLLCIAATYFLNPVWMCSWCGPCNAHGKFYILTYIRLLDYCNCLCFVVVSIYGVCVICAECYVYVCIFE
jgi:hypothetical protein